MKGVILLTGEQQFRGIDAEISEHEWVLCTIRCRKWWYRLNRILFRKELELDPQVFFSNKPKFFTIKLMVWLCASGLILLGGFSCQKIFLSANPRYRDDFFFGHAFALIGARWCVFFRESFSCETRNSAAMINATKRHRYLGCLPIKKIALISQYARMSFDGSCLQNCAEMKVIGSLPHKRIAGLSQDRIERNLRSPVIGFVAFEDHSVSHLGIEMSSRSIIEQLISEMPRYGQRHLIVRCKSKWSYKPHFEKLKQKNGERDKRIELQISCEDECLSDFLGKCDFLVGVRSTVLIESFLFRRIRGRFLFLDPSAFDDFADRDLWVDAFGFVSGVEDLLTRIAVLNASSSGMNADMDISENNVELLEHRLIGPKDESVETTLSFFSS
jgi:hypothetical protein